LVLIRFQKYGLLKTALQVRNHIILSQGSGANITIPAGDTKVVYSDGAGAGAAFFDAFASLSVVDLKVQDDLTVTDDASIGGDATITGASTAATYNGIASKTFGTDSIMIGDTTTGTISAANNNVGLGVDVFAALTSGDDNVAVGFSAGTALTTGEQNTLIGSLAGDALTDADYNVAVGKSALSSDTLGSRSTALVSALDSKLYISYRYLQHSSGYAGFSNHRHQTTPSSVVLQVMQLLLQLIT
jgi:hypothetical protein